jgi:hypothetical protein
MDKQEFQRIWGKVVVRAWRDESFKAQLLADPEAVFREYGFEVPANISVQVLANPDQRLQFRCTRIGAPEWYVECTSSCYHHPEADSEMEIWTMWRAGWTEGLTVSRGTGVSR